jgi:soluble lytic murein transglycosylase
MKRTPVLAVAIVLLTLPGVSQAQPPLPSAPLPVVLSPTNHPRVPRDLSQLWLAPDGSRKPRTPAIDEFVSAVKLEVNGDFARALPILSKPLLQQGTLGPYAEYYKGLAQLRLGRAQDARQTFQAMQSREIVGYLAEAAALREAESAEAIGDRAGALSIYERLSTMKTASPEDVLMRLGRAAKAVGDEKKARAAFARLYYDYPFSEFSPSAAAELESGPITSGSPRYKAGLDRAERLFTAKRYGQARIEFTALRNAAADDERERVDLRIAECDYFLKKPRNTRDQVRPYLEHASRQGEALYFFAVASRDLGDLDDYMKTVRRLVADFATQSWAEEALNSLSTYYILHDEDEKADETLRELYARFPKGAYAERAAWKIGWWAYKSGRFADAAQVFANAAFDFPRSDYRPAWLYWSGRSYDRLNDRAMAEARYTLATTDYLNTYYGRLALGRLADLGLRPPERRLVVDVKPRGAAEEIGAGELPAIAVALPRNEAIVRALLELGLYDQAIDELRYAQKAWGDSSAVQATLAWIYVRQGQSATGSEQFTLFRSAINAMKRAYPQFMASGGEELPRDVLTIIYPIGHWDLIRKYSALHDIDPYLAAALVAQESTFVPDIRSPVNAVGLTQLMTPTARQYARTLKLKWSPALMTNPEANVQIGMAYFADKIREFGGVHLALASYNAGERAVRRWIAEHPGVPRDEFIDDISYPETQQYVKKILGTAEDYRRLYSSDVRRPDVIDATPAVASAPAPPARRASAAAPAKKKKAPSTTPTKKKKARKAA